MSLFGLFFSGAAALISIEIESLASLLVQGSWPDACTFALKAQDCLYGLLSHVPLRTCLLRHNLLATCEMRPILGKNCVHLWKRLPAVDFCQP